MVIGRWNRCHGCAAGSVVDRLRCGSRDAAVGSGGICQGVGVDGKAGGHRYISRHIAVRPRIGRAVVTPFYEMVIRGGNRCHGCAAGSVVDRLRCGSRDAAVGSGDICQDVGVDGKAGRHRYISRHIAVRAGVGCTVVAPTSQNGNWSQEPLSRLCRWLRG